MDTYMLLKNPFMSICEQIMANPQHRFNDSELYKNVALVAWDPSPYSGNLEKVSNNNNNKKKSTIQLLLISMSTNLQFFFLKVQLSPSFHYSRFIYNSLIYTSLAFNTVNDDLILKYVLI